MKIFISLFIGLTGLLLVTYFLGPKVQKLRLNPEIQACPVGIKNIASHIIQHESQFQIKPDNEARLIWADSNQQKTEYAVVYLHGFSASQEEGDSVHQVFAKRYGCNLYLSRLFVHGLATDDPFLQLTVEDYLGSAKEAIAIGKIIGEKVIVMSCSTGSTLALYLAAHNPEWVEALICYSPNIALKNGTAKLITGPWGKQLAKLSLGGEYYTWDGDEEVRQYWYTRYRYEGLVTLQQLLDVTMLPETFCAVEDPVFVGYYNKNKNEQDPIVSVDAIEKMFENLCLDPDQKVLVNFPSAGTHIISSRMHNKHLESVMSSTFEFAEKVIGLVPVD